ncbi:MAG: TatD family hydrolase [Candidatus Omnitrophica bacterium]|nr:TatD family hydrolase [Candidatus Omnitrophota bacterium]
MQIIDTHAHLYDLAEPEAVLSACASAGVSDVVALGVDLASNRKHLELRRSERKYPRLHVGLGLHPGNITPEEVERCFPFFRETLSAGGVAAIGETGLDYWYKWVRKDEARKREQREVFDRHLALAREFDLPVVIHSRGAWRDCLDMLLASGVRRADFHWYSGPEDVLREILDGGFMISATPSLSYSPEARRAAVYAPLERILVETDTPVAYAWPDRPASAVQPGPVLGADIGTALAVAAGRPADPSGRIPSVPSDVWRTLALLAELKGLPIEETLSAVNANARRMFRI